MVGIGHGDLGRHVYQLLTKINKLLSQKQIGDWSEIFNKSLSQNCIGETKHKLCRLGSSEAIELNLRLTTSKRNAHFIFYIHGQ